MTRRSITNTRSEAGNCRQFELSKSESLAISLSCNVTLAICDSRFEAREDQALRTLFSVNSRWTENSHQTCNWTEDNGRLRVGSFSHDVRHVGLFPHKGQIPWESEEEIVRRTHDCHRLLRWTPQMGIRFRMHGGQEKKADFGVQGSKKKWPLSLAGTI